jgi:hypothetical protein
LSATQPLADLFIAFRNKLVREMGMTDSKISFTLGNLSFAGEGDEKWLGAQLEIVIAAAKEFGLKNASKTATDKFLDADEA